MSDNETKVGRTQSTGTPRRNIVLARDGSGNYKTPPTESGPVSIGGIATIELPDLESQKAGFALPEEQAQLLFIQYPGIYKALTASNVVPVRVPPPQGVAAPSLGNQGGAGADNLNNAGGGPDLGQQGGGQTE